MPKKHKKLKMPKEGQVALLETEITMDFYALIDRMEEDKEKVLDHFERLFFYFRSASLNTPPGFINHQLAEHKRAWEILTDNFEDEGALYEGLIDDIYAYQQLSNKILRSVFDRTLTDKEEYETKMANLMKEEQTLYRRSKMFVDLLEKTVKAFTELEKKVSDNAN